MDRSLIVVSVYILLSPDYVPARMGLQDGSQQIPGQCSGEGKRRNDVCLILEFGRLFFCLFFQLTDFFYCSGCSKCD